MRRAVQRPPAKPGTVIASADGHEYITATVGGVTYHAREAILIGKDQPWLNTQAFLAALDANLQKAMKAA